MVRRLIVNGQEIDMGCRIELERDVEYDAEDMLEIIDKITGENLDQSLCSLCSDGREINYGEFLQACV